ncbi:MAG: thioredoxin [Oscillospiraceae bacterium]|nr:thioredoxin [Oscillospiraceae bacterium]
MSPKNITKANFEELVLRETKTVVLDFWAPWCGPCRMVAPILDEIAGEREDVVIGKINVDEEMELAMEFGIVSIPTLVVMKDGKAANKAVGYMPKAEILKLL